MRLADVTIVRVKDLSKLPGPAGEPRIYEALRAGTITIATESDINLDLETRPGAVKIPVLGRADTGRRRSFSIDGKDMFIAFRVATLKTTRSEDVELPLRRREAGGSTSFAGYDIEIDSSVLDRCLCAAASAEQWKICQAEQPVALRLIKTSSEPETKPASVSEPYSLKVGALLEIPLAVPQADGKRGLYSSMVFQLNVHQPKDWGASKGARCAPNGVKAHILASLKGTRIETLSHPKGEAL